MTLTTIERVLKCMEICSNPEANGCDGCPYMISEEDCLEARDKDIVKVINTIKELWNM